MKRSIINRRSLTRVLTLILTLLLLSPAALAASIKATINSSAAKLYKSPTTASESIEAVKGTVVTVSAYSGGWAKISYKGKKGYIAIKYLNLKNRVAAYIYHATPLYSEATSSSSKLKTLSAGTKVYIVGVDGDYAKVQNKSGSMTGFVETDELVSRSQMEAAYAASRGTGSKVNKATALAVSYVGRPYGTHEPSSFNCSSLVQYCFKKYGFSVKGTAAAIATDGSLKKISSYSSCKRGDILCFDSDNDGKCDHVAIYIGKGYFVEASQSAGKVQVNSMSSWYKSHLMWARRVS